MEQMNVMMSIILMIILTVSFAWFTACLSFLVDYCLWDGSIFQNYLPWLAKKAVRKNDRQKFNLIMSMPEGERPDQFEQAAQTAFIYKMMGGCIICTNIWVSFAAFIPVWLFCGVSIWFYLPFVVASSRILRKLIA